jgi:hypothetical protein
VTAALEAHPYLFRYVGTVPNVLMTGPSTSITIESDITSPGV